MTRNVLAQAVGVQRNVPARTGGNTGQKESTFASLVQLLELSVPGFLHENRCSKRPLQRLNTSSGGLVRLGCATQFVGVQCESYETADLLEPPST
eukprot:1708423-Amphidinium_carterae.1